jgi:hypothetical protein
MDDKEGSHDGRSHPAHFFPSSIVFARTKLILSSFIFITVFYFTFPVLRGFNGSAAVMAVWKFLTASFAATRLLGATTSGFKILDLSESDWTVGNADLGIEVKAKFPSVVRISSSL